ncbi:MAG: aKG-HExxH-type peptide beta-hydroxylase [Gemmatimonadaceae bacterium]
MQARHLITATPIRGEAYTYWHAQLGAARLRILDRHVETVRASTVVGGDALLSLVERFRAMPEADRLTMAGTPEFGAWSAAMRDRFERNRQSSDEDAAAPLLARFGEFLLLPLCRAAASSVSVAVTVVDGGFVALPGSPVFFKLQTDRSTASCVVDGGGLTFDAIGGVTAHFPRAELSALLNGTGPVVKSLGELDPGGYRLADFGSSRTNVYLGLPVNEMLNQSRLRMASANGAGADPGSLIAFLTDASPFVDDVGAALASIADAWPEMGEMIGLHTRFIVPIVSDRVFSYSEMYAPNTVFLRARPQNPLWYVELLVHESCHNWLASLMEIIPIVDADQERRYESPWRTDPRPLIGIVFGTHAFTFVTLCLLRLLEQGRVSKDAREVERRVRFEAKRVARGYALIREHGKFTAAGAMFLEDLGLAVDDVQERVSRLNSSSSGAEGMDDLWPTVV